MKKQTVLGVLLLFVMFCFNAKAEVITVEGASEIANAFFTQSARSQKTQLKSATQLEYAWDSNSLTQSGSSMLKSVEEDPTFYVFNNPDGEGFVIVSGDSNTRSIIGYSFEGNAPAVTDIPLPMQDYLSGIDAEVKYARTNLTSTSKNLKETEAETGGTVVKHLETAIWNQEAPFGNKASNGLSGCVPTAFAIVMRYHEWPLQGKVATLPSGSQTIDLSSHIYDWSKMPLSYSNGYTEEQGEAVAQLMSDLGASMAATYNSGSTDVQLSSYIGRYFQPNFDYSGEYDIAQKDVSYVDNEGGWIARIQESIDRNCPIPYSGTRIIGEGEDKTHGTHMFVLDGYTDTNYFHFNFGWGGVGNGWFTLSTMGEEGSQYIQSNKAFFNLKPNKQVTVSVAADPATEGSVTIDGESVESKVVEAGSTVILQATGNNFYGWLVNGEVVSTENPYSATINSGITYTAKFATSTNLNLMAALVTEGGGYDLDDVNKPTASTYTITEGVSIELNANTQRGYSFLGWYDADENLIDSETPTTINITSQIYGNPYVFAKYSQLSPITTTSFVTSADAGMGTVSCKFNGNPVSEVYEGESVTLTASPIDASYIFKNWTLNGADIQGGAEITVSVVAGQSYVANFIATSELADITVNMNKGGTVSINGGSASSQAKVTDVQVGSYITIQAHPVSPNEFLYWVDYSDETSILSEENPWNFQVTGTARYKAIMGEPLVVTATSAGTGGTAIAYPTKVLSGKTTTLTATPTQGYEFVNWTLNGVEVSTENPYTATITESAEYVANFSQTGSVTPTQYTASVEVNGTNGSATVAVGTGEASSSVTVDSGTEVTFNANPADGYNFVNWTKGTETVSSENPYTVAINETTTLTANFEKATTQYTITVSASPAEGGTATVAVGTGEASSSVTVDAGTNVTITATPAEGYEFVNWTNGGNLLSTNTTETYPISANITLTANFRQTEQGGDVIEVAQLDRTNWSVTASSQAPEEGAINGGEARHAIDNSTTTFWHTQWQDSTPDVPHWIQFNMGAIYKVESFNYVSRDAATTNITGNGNIKTYKLYISDSDISADINATSYIPNGLTPVKDENFVYDGSTANHNVTLDSPVYGQYIYMLVTDSYNSHASIKFANCADFQVYGKPAYTVSATASPVGGGTASVSANVIGSGESVTFTASPNTGYNFLGWYNGENKVSESLEYTATVTSDLSLTAKFAKQTFTVSATPEGTNGTVTVSPNGTVEYGTQVTFTANANAGYRFTSWSNGETSNPYTTTITTNTTLTASFEALQSYSVNVTTNNNAGGTATASQGTVYENGTVTLTAEAADGYRFTGWYQNGELVTMANPYTIQSVTGDIDYVANFVESSDELLLTFACLSDLHAQQDFITDANNIRLRESATKTLAKIKEQENVDLIVLGGDYTSNNAIPETSWETTRELLVNATRGAFNGTKTPVIYVNGNHDYEVANYNNPPREYNAGEYYGTPMKTDIGALATEDCFYETADNGIGTAFSLLAAYHYVVNGFDFVVLNAGKNLFTSASDYSYSTESVEWCKTKLAEIYATDKNKTVFFLVHIPFSDSNSLNSGKGMASNTATTLLKTTLAQYPNLIMLYGHDHGGDTAYIRTATEQRVTEYATNGDVYTGEGSASSLYYIQNYNTNKYLGYNSYNLATTDTQSSDVTITTSTVTDGAFVFDLSTTLTNNVGTIRYLHCGGSGRFSGNNENGATNQQIKVFKVEDPSAATLTATQVTEITSGGTYMLVASNDGTNYYALTNEITYNTENDNSSQRMVGAAVTITDGTITYTPGTASVLWNIVLKPSATDKSFISSFMGSMRYYENTIEGTDQLIDRKIIQALMVYVYTDRVELKMKNYGQSGTINGVTVNQDLTPYISYRTVTHSDYAVTATPTITSTGDDVNAETEVTVTVDAPEWHNLYYTINGDTPTESSDKVENGQITFTATEGEYVVKVVAQEGIRLVSPVAEVTYRVVDTHGITVSATEGGTADFSINEGEGTVTLTATEPTEGYKFVGWSVGESAEIVSEDLTYTISIVENAAYKANYAKRTYTVTVSTNNEEWGTVNTIANPVTHGETVTLTATPAEGYRFVNWTVSENQVSTEATFTTDAITADVEYIANFEEIPQTQYYSVVAIAGTGGSATASSSSVEENTTVTLTATPDSGYTFRNWTVAGEEVSTDNPYIPTITADTKYVAHFVPENANTLPTGYCTVTQRMNESCSTNAPTDVHSHSLQGLTATYDGNEVLSLPATTATFNDLTSSKQFTVTQGGTIEISFTNGAWSKNVWFGFDWDRDGDFEDVVAAYPEEGRVGGTSDQGSVTINVPDNANIGKSVMRIISDGVDCPASWSEDTPMCGTHGSGIIGYAGSLHDVTLYVEEGYVSDVTYNVTVSSADENMGTASASRNIVPEKLTVILDATPADGYYFTGWSANGVEDIISTANPYKPVITQDMEFVAHFDLLPTYTVTATSSDNEKGLVSPASSQVVSGKTITLTATPLPRYRFVNWTKGGDVVSTNATYTTEAITADVEYVANFEFATEELTVSTSSTNFGTYQSYSINNIKDNNYGTKFWSNAGQEEGKYIMLDLGAEYDVVAIKLHFMGTSDIPVGADVQVSLTNNNDWETVSSFGASGTYEQRTEGTNTISCHSCVVDSKSARYVRMIITQATEKWLQMAEFEVFKASEVRTVVTVAKSTATSNAAVVVTTDAPATITVGTNSYNTTTENNLTVEVPIQGAEETSIESVGGCIVSVDCKDNSYPTTLPLSATELALRNVNAGEVEIEAPLLEKITIVSDDDDNVATVATTSDLSQGVQVVVEKEIKTPQTLGDGTTPTIFNFLSMPFAFNTAGIKYWDGDSWETAEPENHVRILLYDSQKRANQDYKNTWEKITTSTHKTVAANQGFVIVGNNDLGTTVKLQFTSEVAAYDGSVTSVTANRYRKDTGETNGQDGDWNLNGVPYLTAGEFAEDYTLYTYDNSTLSYVSHTPASGLPTLKPYQAVMYQAEIAGEEMTKEIAINSASISNANASENVYARAYISIDDSTPAKIILSDETSENFVVNEDAWYMPSLINTTPAAYFNVGGAEASVSVQPAANELPMTVYTGAGTSHRISLTATDGNYNVYLKDAATDETVCLNDEDYTFTATAKTTIADRFTVSMLEPTGIIDAARAEGAIKPVVLSNAIKLYGTEEGDQVSLYTANGMIITNAVTEEGVTTIPTSVTGVIIIKVAGETIKVVK